MIATLFPRPFRSSRKRTSDTSRHRSLHISGQDAERQSNLKASISKPTPVTLTPNERPESETSSASGATFSTVSEKAALSLVPCGICKRSFDAQSPEALFAHLGGHFDRRHNLNRCEECQINFVSKADLESHVNSVSQHKSCGFMFQHRQPCTGHHPPRRRELKDDSRFDFCYRLQRWEGIQLEASRAGRLMTEQPPLEVSTRSTKTFSIASMSDIMRFSRMSRLPKAEDIEKSLGGRWDIAPSDALGAALLRAICTANLDLVACFIDARANIHVVDALGFGVMHYNAQYGSPEIGWLLMQAGADPNGIDRRGRSPLSHAVAARNPQLVHYFLAWGAQPRVHDLKTVVNSGHVENTEFLLQWWNRQGKPKEALDSLLITAVNKQDRDMVELLLENGANATAADDSGKSALSLAAQANDKATVLLLLENGAEPDGWNRKDDRPLAEVIRCRNFATAEMLCAKVS